MVYVWYSGATDITGLAIATELSTAIGEQNVSSGQNFPSIRPDLLVCYGCKPGDWFDYSRLDGMNVLNHPRKIRENVNKLEALSKMRNAGVLVADYWTADQVIRSGLPDMGRKIYIARKRHHQGGKGVVLIAQNSDIQFALDQGMEYFQLLIPKDTEYRVHVMNGEVLFAVKKILQENPYDNWRTDRRELIEKKAEADRINLDEATLMLALDICGKSMRLPDNIVRGLHRGWKFSSLSNPARAIQEIAVAAVIAVELDFGAVDVMKGDDGSFYVLEVNSGPGLKGQNIDRYVSAIRQKYEEATRPVRSSRTNRSRSSKSSAPEARGVENPTEGRRNIAATLEEAMADISSMSRDERDEIRGAMLRIASRL